MNLLFNVLVSLFNKSFDVMLQSGAVEEEPDEQVGIVEVGADAVVFVLTIRFNINSSSKERSFRAKRSVSIKNCNFINLFLNGWYF